MSETPLPCAIDQPFVAEYERQVAHWSRVSLPKVKWPTFKIMLGGDQYYATLFNMIERANSHIFIVSYTFDSSVVSLHILENLMKALQRGVRVYLFLENLIELPRKDRLDEFKRAGGVVIQRSKGKSFQSMLNKTFFQRDHEKLFIADNQFVLGSANISEHYGDRRFGKPFFYDMNFHGKNCLSRELAEFLESYVDYRKLGATSKYTRLQHDLEDYVAQFKSIPLSYRVVKFYSAEVPFNMSLQRKILDLIAEAQRNIKIISAYYYPIRAVEEALVEARKRGVAVELITSRKRDIPAYKNFVNGVLFNNLLLNGIRVYEFRERYLHAKAIAIDDRIVNLGSFNLDRWSWYNNIETVVHVEDSPQESADYETAFQTLKAKSEPIGAQLGHARLSKLVRNLFWDNFFLRTCDRLMNRAFFAFHTEMENSLFVKMHRYLSWAPPNVPQTAQMKLANELIGKVPLNDIKRAVKEE